MLVSCSVFVGERTNHDGTWKTTELNYIHNTRGKKKVLHYLPFITTDVIKQWQKNVSLFKRSAINLTYKSEAPGTHIMNTHVACNRPGLNEFEVWTLPNTCTRNQSGTPASSLFHTTSEAISQRSISILSFHLSFGLKQATSRVPDSLLSAKLHVKFNVKSLSKPWPSRFLHAKVKLPLWQH